MQGERAAVESLCLTGIEYGRFLSENSFYNPFNDKQLHKNQVSLNVAFHLTEFGHVHVI